MDNEWADETLMRPEPLPRPIWQVSVIALIGAVVFTIVLLTLSLAGISDPRPIGRLVISDDFAVDRGWHLLSLSDQVRARVTHGKYVMDLSGSPTRAMIISPYTTHPPCTIIIIASQVAGSTDAHYGVWWADKAAGPQFILGMNSDGYLAIFRASDRDQAPIEPWRIFPHVKASGNPNKIQIDAESSEVTIRLNDEFVTRFTTTASEDLSLGLYAENMTPGETELDFGGLEIWENTNGHSH